MRKQGCCGGSRDGVLDQRRGEKGRKCAAPIFRCGKGWWWTRGDFEQDLHGMQIVVWRLGLGQLDGRDGKGPNVAGGVVRVGAIILASHNLWGHPCTAADEGGALLRSGFAQRADAEIGQLDDAAGRQQGVACVEIAVDDELAVKKGQCGEHLLHGASDLRLGKGRLLPLHDVVQRPARTQLDDDPEIALGEVGVEEVRDVLMVTGGQYFNLVGKVVQLIGRLDGRHLCGRFLSRLAVANAVHFAIRAGAQFRGDLP